MKNFWKIFEEKKFSSKIFFLFPICIGIALALHWDCIGYFFRVKSAQKADYFFKKSWLFFGPIVIGDMWWSLYDWWRVMTGDHVIDGGWWQWHVIGDMWLVIIWLVERCFVTLCVSMCVTNDLGNRSNDFSETWHEVGGQ